MFVLRQEKMRCSSILALFFISGAAIQPTIAQTTSLSEETKAPIAPVQNVNDGDVELDANSESNTRAGRLDEADQEEARSRGHRGHRDRARGQQGEGDHQHLAAGHHHR